MPRGQEAEPIEEELELTEEHNNLLHPAASRGDAEEESMAQSKEASNGKWDQLGLGLIIVRDFDTGWPKV